MAKFFGNVGYGIPVEVVLGVWEDSIVVKEYSGDVLRNSRKLMTASSTLNDNVQISNEISILADPFANENFLAIRYIEYMGAKWKVETVEVQRPRLILSMGGVYNGQQN